MKKMSYEKFSEKYLEMEALFYLSSFWQHTFHHSK